LPVAERSLLFKKSFGLGRYTFTLCYSTERE
jgi:hypothetical protein